MFKTRITELLGIQYPIIGGTMMDITLAPFVAAISNAGALGIIASAVFKDPEKLRLEIRKTRELTDKPFAVNINLFPQLMPPDNRAFLDVLSAEGVRIVETSGYQAPVDLVALFREYGMTWIHKCVGVRYAKKVASLGADAVTVVGYENGGATGILNITTLVLVPSTVDAVKIPVIGGGGVADGRGLYAVLSLGAEAAIVGSRFVLSDECPVHPNLKQALCQADELSTDLIMFSVGFTHRVWMNEPAKKTLEIEKRGGSLEEILPYVSGEAARKMYQTGDLNAGTISISQSIGIPRKIMPVRDIIAEMIGQAQEIHNRMAKIGMA
ncbi:MAG: nitronate monooxygenase [Desulfobacteraceae bacterium]|nr:MAG: nitronate monooxygenase [Desulfobacteraceae bacterium]